MRNSVPRRDVGRLGIAGTLGIASLVLPQAAASASGSVLSAEGTAIDFSGTSRLAAWSLGAASSLTYPQAATAVLDGSGVSAAMTYGGTTITPQSDSRHVWRFENVASTLDTTTAPYLEWSLTTTTKAVRLQAFALHGIAWWSATLTFACDLDGYGAVLRQQAGGNGGSYQNLLVNLSGLPTIGTASSVRIRMFAHAIPVLDTPYLPTASNNAGVTALDTYDAVQGFANMSLIGTPLS